MSARPAASYPPLALHSQRTFRRIMDAMARPGLIVNLDLSLDAPAPLMPAAAEVLVTLCDFETSLWLSPRVAAASDWLRFQTDSRIAPQSRAAAFALIEAQELDLTLFATGTPSYPDRGATVLVQCHALTGGPELTLAGPGIAATAPFAVQGLPDNFALQARANRALFPLGVDLVFVSGSTVLALPRSTRILEAR